VKRAEDFEEHYNFRFEQKGSAELVGHARNIEGSVRQADTRRKEKRERKNERALSQVEQKKEELRRLKNIKKQEILARLKTIQNISGAREVDSVKLDLEEEFHLC
jgi:protein KRI1